MKFFISKLIFIALMLSNVCLAQESGIDLTHVVGTWWDKLGNKYIISQEPQEAVLTPNLAKVKKEIESGNKNTEKNKATRNGIEVTTHEKENGTLEIITRYPGDKQIVQVRPAIKKTEKVESIDQQIKTLEAEIAQLNKNKSFVWINRKTKEKVEQSKFEKLPNDEYEYYGEQFHEANGRQLLAEKEKHIEELRKIKHYFLIDTTDPINYAEVSHNKKAIKLTITVENPNYTFHYPEAYYLNGKIVARRVLTDPLDITDVPINLIGQLLSEWSPPEWLVLSTTTNPEILNGQIWRLHVTYEPGNAAIVGVHSPFGKDLVLTKKPPVT
jgi:hypothetical protein